MIFPWHAQNPSPAPAPRPGTELARFFAAVAPPASLLPSPASRRSPALPATLVPIAYTGESTQHLAELRIRQWMLQQEHLARQEHARRLQSALPPRK